MAPRSEAEVRAVGESIEIEVTVRVRVDDVTPEMVRSYLEVRGWREEPAGWLPPTPAPLTHVRLDDGKFPRWPIVAMAKLDRCSPLQILAEMRALFVGTLLRDRLPSAMSPVVTERTDGGIDIAMATEPVSEPVATWGVDVNHATDWRPWADEVAARWRSR
jgi:hypothetical protein